MIQSHDEPIMEMADEYGLNRMGENDEDDNEENDDDDVKDATASSTAPEVIIVEDEENPMEMVSEQEAPEELEIITPEVEPKPPQPRLYTMLMRDYEESP
jgi:hypothetical protein